MSLLGLFKSKGPNGFGYSTTASQVTEGLSLAGKSYLLTGCNSGLGLEATRVLASRGARVFGTARTVAKATEAFAGSPGSLPASPASWPTRRRCAPVSRR